MPDGLFDLPDPALRKLANSVYQQCILGKVFAPRGTLKQCWIAPGGGYNGQWIWDTMFVVDLLSILPDQQPVIREVFQNFWDFQVRWYQAICASPATLLANQTRMKSAITTGIAELFINFLSVCPVGISISVVCLPRIKGIQLARQFVQHEVVN